MKPEKFAVHVPTQDLSHAVQRECQRRGMKWYGGEAIPSDAPVFAHGTDACINPGTGVSEGEMMYCLRGRYDKNGYRIISAEEFLAAPDAFLGTKPAEEPAWPYPAGTRVRINEEGHKRYGELDHNPRGVIGTAGKPNSNGWLAVQWENGAENHYGIGTLDVVDEPVKEKEAEKPPPSKPESNPKPKFYCDDCRAAVWFPFGSIRTAAADRERHSEYEIEDVKLCPKCSGKRYAKAFGWKLKLTPAAERRKDRDEFLEGLTRRQPGDDFPVGADGKPYPRCGDGFGDPE